MRAHVAALEGLYHELLQAEKLASLGELVATVDANTNSYMLPLSGQAVTITAKGIGFRQASARITLRGGSQTCRINGQSVQVDVSALTANDGDVVYNTNAGALCGIGSIVYNTAAGKWKNLYTGATT